MLALFNKALIQDSVNDYNIMPANSRRSLCLAKLYDLQNLLTAGILQLGPQEEYHEDFRIIFIQKVIFTRVLYKKIAMIVLSYFCRAMMNLEAYYCNKIKLLYTVRLLDNTTTMEMMRS